mmetsp:Transcript_64362/g.94243  ORF Transcript_64362/g.94243 Transcript_64362/m.94243 type:complete len:81 (-) Transcript_64362:85-327(-)
MKLTARGAPRCIYSQDMLSPPQRVCAYFPRDLLLLLPTMMGSCLFITSSFTPAANEQSKSFCTHSREQRQYGVEEGWKEG